jgi:hypothetical protein
MASTPLQTLVAAHADHLLGLVGIVKVDDVALSTAAHNVGTHRHLPLSLWPKTRVGDDGELLNDVAADEEVATADRVVDVGFDLAADAGDV